MMRRLGPGSPSLFQVNLKDIPPEGLPMDGEVNPQDLELPADEGKVAGVFRWEGGIQKTPEGASVNGTLSGVIVRDCVRCLQEFRDLLSVSCSAVFQDGPDSMGERSEDEDSMSGRGTIHDLSEEAYPCLEGQVDLRKMWREQIILTTPIQPLCRQDCLGLCDTCGHNFNQGPCHCPKKNSSVKHGNIRFRV